MKKVLALLIAGATVSGVAAYMVAEPVQAEQVER